MADFVNTAKATRGSALYTDPQGKLRDKLEECFRFVCSPKVCADKVQYGYFNGTNCKLLWRQARALPEGEDFFENIWRTYRQNKSIY